MRLPKRSCVLSSGRWRFACAASVCRRSLPTSSPMRLARLRIRRLEVESIHLYSFGCARAPSVRRATPQLLQPGVAPAAGAVELVAHRILDVEILVIVLGRPERSGRDDGSDDGVL